MLLIKFGALKTYVHNVWYIGTRVLQFEFHVLDICTLHLAKHISVGTNVEV